jgi:hypothetical protein
MTHFAFGLTAAAAFGFLSGCSEPQPAPTNSSPATSPDTGGESGHEGHENHEAHQHGEHRSEFTAALAELSAEDREAAEHQGTCPVTGEPLGSMGTPIKVEVNGKPVFICCEGCREELLADPDKFLGKLE